MKEMSKFQLIFTGVFAVFIVAGVMVFSLSRGGSGAENYNITLWGDIPSELFSQVWSELPIKEDKTITVNYVEKDFATFDRDFVEALASGVGPDVVMLSADNILKHKNKILIIPFENYSERLFKDSFVEAGELFLDETGVMAVPVRIDPLVMYWNRDIFNTISESKAPQFWSDFYNLINRITKKDASLSITQSALALGEYRNIDNAKAILSALFLQSGTPITSKNSNSEIVSALGDYNGLSVSPAESALVFYTEFANPVKTYYSWNRSLPSSQKYFLAGDLGVYFGFASELLSIRTKNPNINFDVSLFPQLKDSEKRVTYANISGLAIVKASKSYAGALKVINALTASDSVKLFANALSLPPVRRDLLAQKPGEAYLSTFYTSALWSRGWLDPDRGTTISIFQDMVESVTGGRSSAGDAVRKTSGQIDVLLNNIQ